MADVEGRCRTEKRLRNGARLLETESLRRRSTGADSQLARWKSEGGKKPGEKKKKKKKRRRGLL